MEEWYSDYRTDSKLGSFSGLGPAITAAAIPSAELG
jgi:hypothetical protein